MAAAAAVLLSPLLLLLLLRRRGLGQQRSPTAGSRVAQASRSEPATKFIPWGQGAQETGMIKGVEWETRSEKELHTFFWRSLMIKGVGWETKSDKYLHAFSGKA